MDNDINDMLKAAAKATESVAALTLEQTNAILMDVAACLREESDAILAANRLDTEALLADRIGADSPGAERIGAVAAAADRQAAAAKIPGYDLPSAFRRLPRIWKRLRACLRPWAGCWIVSRVLTE